MESDVSASGSLSNTEATIETESAAKFEYEAQHFGFTPITLLNGMFNAVCDHYREALQAFCKTCSEKYPNVMTEEELKIARHAVSELVDKDICMMFDKLEYFLLDQVFSIPGNTVLPEDRCQLQRLNADEYHELEKKVTHLKRQITAVKYANAVLSQHLKDAEVQQSYLDKFLEHVSPAESKLGAKDLTDFLSYFSEMLKKGSLVKEVS